jgi:hypothetical protein
LLAAGALIERIGFPLTLTAGAAVGLLCTLLIGAKWRASMWRRRPRAAGSASAPQRV